VVVIGERVLEMQSVRQWVPGSILELQINAESDLDVRINNRRIAKGSAVKIGENFGIRLTTTLGQTERIEALGPAKQADDSSLSGMGEMTPDEIADAMLAGQM